MSESLDILLADGVIDAVLGQLKSGKEAEVWLVQQGEQVLAAKIYKERHARNFKNNAGYREGREVRNSRTARAMAKGSRFGQAAAEEAWRSAEADSLFKLHAQGVRVPTPVVFYEGILLMELVLDPEGHPAPRLVEAPPATPEEARAMYLDLRQNVIRMLSADLIHGDLSAYNVLMSWCGPTIIDFPQTLAAARNNRAEFYFRRDLDNVRNFLAGVDPGLGSLAGDTGEIWNAYVRRELSPDFVPSGRFREAPRRNGFRPEQPAQERPAQQPRRDPAPPRSPRETSGAPLDPVEAELRELEALVLRQGGGARAKPAPAQRPSQGNNRSRPNGPGRRGPPARPPTNGNPARGPSGRPPQGNDRSGRPGNRTEVRGGPSGRPQPRNDGPGRPGNGTEVRGGPSGRPPPRNDRPGRPAPTDGNEVRGGPSGRPPQRNGRPGRPVPADGTEVRGGPSGRPPPRNDRPGRPAPADGNEVRGGPSGRPPSGNDRPGRPGNSGGPGGTRQDNRRGPGPNRKRAAAQSSGPVVSYVNRPPRGPDSGSNEG